MKEMLEQSIYMMIREIDDHISLVDNSLKSIIEEVASNNMENNVTPIVVFWGTAFGSFLLVKFLLIFLFNIKIN